MTKPHKLPISPVLAVAFFVGVVVSCHALSWIAAGSFWAGQDVVFNVAMGLGRILTWPWLLYSLSGLPVPASASAAYFVNGIGWGWVGVVLGMWLDGRRVGMAPPQVDAKEHSGRRVIAWGLGSAAGITVLGGVLVWVTAVAGTSLTLMRAASTDPMQQLRGLTDLDTLADQYRRSLEGEAEPHHADLKRQCEQAFPVLMELLRDDQAFVRAKAIDILALMGLHKERALSAILEKTRDEDAEVRGAVCLALSRLAQVEDDRVTSALIALAKDPDATVRWVAVRELPHVPVPTAVQIEILQESLFDPDASVRSWAVMSLPVDGVAAVESVGLSRAALSDPDELVRVLAAEALAKSGAAARASLPDLRKAASDDESRDVRDAATEAIRKIEGSTPAPPRDPGD